MPPSPAADRNLLFGILALQMDFIQRDALIAAMHAWVLDKAKPLGQILVEQGALPPGQRGLLEPLVEAHLEMHGGDAEKSLAAVGVPTPLRHDLHSLGDGDVLTSLAHLPTPSGANGAAPLPATTAEAKGTGLRYQVLRPHGRGGLGEVFVALDQELRREVALKEIRAEHADDPLSRGRFVREAEVTGGLEHPGIVPVYGLGTYGDGRPFYAMRFIQGETLKEAIDKYQAGDGSWTLRGLLTRFVAVCNTVAYAHSRGVLHRDLKPANVMLGRYGETLLVDWGLAKPLAEQPGRGTGDATVEPALVPGLVEGIETQAGAALGTPAYMSPEQALGRLDLLGPASDIYGLGATLYTVLTGRPPVEGKDMAQVLRKAQRGEWLPPRRVKADLPAALDAVCRKALALQPEQRYTTALELAADVERWLADEPVSAWREPWAVRGRRWMRRHRPLVSTAVGVLVVAMLGATVGLVLVSGAREREATARKTAEDKAEEARYNQYVAQMNLVQRIYEANNLGRVRELLEVQVPRKPGAKDYRDFEWYYWQRITGQRELLILKGHSDVPVVRGVAYSPDGKRLASAGGGGRNGTTGELISGEVKVWDAASGQEVLTLKGHGPVGGVVYSPDGRRLASWDTRGTVLWDAASGQEVLTLPMVYGVAYSPDGRRLASKGDGTVRVFDPANGQELLTLKGHKGPVRGVAYSPDGRRLASAGEDRTVRVWDAASGEELLTLKEHSAAVTGVAYSPDGRRLASASKDRTVRVWDASTGQELSIFWGHTEGINSVVYSPDGRRLASAGWDRTVRVWDATGGRELFSLKGHTQYIYDLAYSPDGRRLTSASFDHTVRVWDVAEVQELLTLKGHKTAVMGVAYSPDGRRLASASNDATVRVWNAASGEELLSLKAHKGGVWGVAYSPDGRRLASAGEDRTVRVWDAASGEELLTLKDHTEEVNGVVFSPDGRRLASAGWDGTVRVWDAASGEELLTLKGHAGRVNGVAYSPDGRRLASAGDDLTVRVWDAAGGQELLSLKGDRYLAVNRVAYSPDGRQLASTGRDGTVRVWEASPVPAELLHRRALVSDVHARFAELLFREEVLAALRKDSALNEADREFALQVAQTHSEEDGTASNGAAWEVVKRCDAGKDAYGAALRKAQAAVRLSPGVGMYVNTLGVAYYRFGDHAKALETLEQSAKARAADGPPPEDLAFLAMAHHQLGHKSQAQATLARLREVMKQPAWAKNAEAEGFLREAEELIEGKAADKKE
jgi:WD40 repeat protein/serine/threonine protein kinase